MSGARPIFADIDSDSQNVTAATIAPLISTKTKAIIAVHLAGWPCDMPEIMELAKQHGLAVVEDCAQAIGARVDGRLVGTFGDAACFSFCQDKIISTAGEGGMLVTRDPSLWKTAWEFKDHGKSWDRVYEASHEIGFRWLHSGFGSNWRMTEIQGALGRLQLGKLNDWLSIRRRNAERLYDVLRDLSVLRLPRPAANIVHANYKFYAFVNTALLNDGWTRDLMLAAISAEGIPGLSGSCPEIYREKAFDGHGHAELPVARELGETSIMLLVHPTLAPSDVDDIIVAVRKVCRAASR